MDALLTTFLATAFAEFGDKTQLLVVALVARYGRTGRILLGIGVGALASSLVAALAGSLLHDVITARAASLLVVVALGFAAVSGLIGGKHSDVGAHWKIGAFLTTTFGFFLLELGDKTQLLTGALAAHFDSLVFAAVGATAGVIAASLPAVLLGPRLPNAVPLRSVRIGIAILFLVVGFIVAVNVLELI